MNERRGRTARVGQCKRCTAFVRTNGAGWAVQTNGWEVRPLRMLCAVLIAVAMLPAGDATTAPVQAKAIVKLGYVGKQEPVNVAVTKDGTVEVQLDSNPTTGYTWTMASSGKGLEQTGSQYLAKSPEGMVGGGGIQTYTFKATGEGKNDLVFVYKRAWEKEEANRAQVIVDIK